METLLECDSSAVTNGIGHVVETWEHRLLNLSNDAISKKKNKQNRTIKQIIGHLVDSASNNHQRIVRLQYNRNLVFPDYTQDNDRWIAIQHYQDSNWENLVQLWKFFNLHMMSVIQCVDQSALNNSWTDSKGQEVTLDAMIVGYLAHLHLHMGEIQEIIEM